VQRNHEQGGQALAERVDADQPLELADQLGCQPSPEIGVEPQLHRFDPLLFETRHLGLDEGLVEKSS
jgi:hypothetical protein